MPTRSRRGMTPGWTATRRSGVSSSRASPSTRRDRARTAGRVSGLRARGAGLRSEAEVGERELAVEVGDEPRHLAVADVEQARCFGLHSRDLQSGRLAASAGVVEHKDALVVELAGLIRRDAEFLPCAQP